MGKPRKQNKKFNYNTDRKKLWKKSKKLPTIKCTQIRTAWDETRTVEQNMKDMGLSTNPNRSIKMHKTKKLMNPNLPEGSVEMQVDEQPSKSHVVAELEDEANKKIPSHLRVSEPEWHYCVQMMEKYGEDYKLMARDVKNYYQDTPKQIKKRINRFKHCKQQYAAYLKVKQREGAGGFRTPARPTWLDMMARRRSYTRKAKAAYRNGHYHSPDITPSRSVNGSNASFCHVRRRLQFGRTPPRVRPPSSVSSDHRVRFDMTPKHRTRPNPSKQIVGILRTSLRKASGRIVKPTRQKRKVPSHRSKKISYSVKSSKLHREIIQLLMGSCNMLPCRLRSEQRQSCDILPHASHEHTNLV